MSDFEVLRELLNTDAAAPKELDVELGPEEIEQELFEDRSAAVQFGQEFGSVSPENRFVFRELCRDVDAAVVVVRLRHRDLATKVGHERFFGLKFFVSQF